MGKWIAGPSQRTYSIPRWMAKCVRTVAGGLRVRLENALTVSHDEMD